MSHELLFRAIDLPNLSLRNRLVMAPMTRSKAAGGVLKQSNIDYYSRRAEGGIGLIISEGACINHAAASGYPDVPFIGRDDTLEGWKQLAATLKTFDTALMPQLWHVGGVRKPGVEPGGKLPGYSPSGLAAPHKMVGKAMDLEDIEQTIQAYADAALQARQAGCAGVEIHGAHGYLIDQFFWSETNLRKDRYGGDLQSRSTFAIEVIAAIRRAVGADFAISFRFSQWKQQDYSARLCQTPEELGRFVRPLAEAGVDIFHCSTRRFWEPEFEGSPLNLAGWVKQLTGKPTITVGSVGLNADFLPRSGGEAFREAGAADLDELISRLHRDEFDLVGVGRALIANPDWANKVRDGRFSELEGFSQTMLGSL